MRPRHERRNRYSIRKFSVGVASVVIATLFCGAAGGPQVVQAADGSSGPRPQGVSLSLEAYKKDLQDQLRNLSLSDQERAKYEQEIENGDQTSLDQLRTRFTQLQDQQTQEAIDKANQTLRQHMETLLQELENKSGSGFSNLLEKLKEVVGKYQGLFDNAPNRKTVEGLEGQARGEMATHIAEYKKTLTTDPGGDQTTPAPTPGGDQTTPAPTPGGDQTTPAPTPGGDQTTPAPVPGGDQTTPAPTPGGDQTTPAPTPGGDQTTPAPTPGGDQTTPAPVPGGQGQGGTNNGAGQGGASQTPPAEKEQPSKPVLPLDSSKPSSRNQTFTGTVGNVNVTVVFDKPVNADKVTIKEVTQPDLVERIGRQAGGGSIRLFDLTVTRDGKETHVNEGRIVRLALEGLGEGVQVYHVREDGKLDPIPSRVEDGHVIFRINHFSLFAIKTMSTKSNQETPSNQATPSTQAKSTPKATTKDTTSKKTLPNTGTADSTALLAAATTTAILGLGLAGRRRKED